jgi:uncharacterized protein (DUF58 family)
MREPVEGVYPGLADLARLEYRARGFTLLPRQPVHSLLAGQHGSRLRGRGLNFDELRAYVAGDDVRSIDWAATARMRTPYVRIYTEERDRPVVFVVDQRQAMFFGTRRAMKSFTAAEVTALGAWRAFRQGDRVGGWVFDDMSWTEQRPHRSRQSVLRLFQLVLDRAHALEAGRAIRGGQMLDDVLDQVHRRAYHDHVIVVISDFDGAGDRTRRTLMLLKEHNDVIAVPVLDPSRTTLPESGRLVVSDGALQVELDLDNRTTREALVSIGEKSVDQLTAWEREIRVPVLPILTSEDPARQLQRLLGARQATRRAP